MLEIIFYCGYSAVVDHIHIVKTDCLSELNGNCICSRYNIVWAKKIESSGWKYKIDIVMILSLWWINYG